MEKIVVVGIARTPMGAFMGQFSGLSAPHLGGQAIKAALADAKVDPRDVDQVIMGNVISAGAGQAPARQAALYGGVPVSVTAMTINKVCGSGMKSVMLASQALTLGEAKVVVAGGMESMSCAPYLLAKGRGGYRIGHGELADAMYTDGLQDAYQGELMGVYAEATATRFGFTRGLQDAFALRSLERAQSATEQGAFTREITPVAVKTRGGEEIFKHDEPLLKAKPEKIPNLKPAFQANGTVTAANASAIADGAAALVLTTESYALSQNLSVLARIASYSEFSREPEWFTLAPVDAMKVLLQQLNWTSDSVDLFEVNEAFAVVAMAATQALDIDPEKLNIHGGACALGHPLGASGARILVSLISALEQKSKKRGVASLCIGGGEAVALGLERPG